ncbi:MAG: hypothetical protein J6U20_10120 [Fibrobacter sp.]|nr:hypothetical protein [Fibrobacter sp.]
MEEKETPKIEGEDSSICPVQTGQAADGISESNKKRGRKAGAGEGFIARVDLDSLKKELGFSSIEEIGVFVNLSNPKGVYNWSKDQANHGTRPSYNAIVRMMRSGATSKSLFGVESSCHSEEPQNIVITDDLVAEMMLRAGELLKKKDS